MAIDGRDMCCEMSWGCEIAGGSHFANWVIAKLGHPPLTNYRGGVRCTCIPSNFSELGHYDSVLLGGHNAIQRV